MKKLISDFQENAHPLLYFGLIYIGIFIACYIGAKIFHWLFPDEIEN